MKKLRKQIKESFFNPILHFLPLLIFLVVDEFSGMDVAWKISFPVALMLIFYVYYTSNQIFIWHLVFTLMYMGIGVFSSIAQRFPFPFFQDHLEDKIVVLIFILGFLIFRKQIQAIISRIMPKLIPMSNNFNELYRVIWALFSVLTFYLLTDTLLHFLKPDRTEIYVQLLHAIFIGLIVFMAFYEILRVQIIRAKLVQEEWWPIVNEKGNIIGSIQHLTSLNDEKKYLHPVVRVFLIDKNMIFLQKRLSTDLIYPDLWDTAVSNHIRMGETVEQCIERTAKEHYALTNFKYMHLSNYTFESKNEKHYAFLFVSCQLSEINPNSSSVKNTKWWTQEQISDNLNSGIFTDNFKIEFDLLSRSGLLETGQCNCACKLKEVIYQSPDGHKKE